VNDIKTHSGLSMGAWACYVQLSPF